MAQFHDPGHTTAANPDAGGVSLATCPVCDEEMAAFDLPDHISGHGEGGR